MFLSRSFCFAGAHDWEDVANHYLDARMLYASSYQVRPFNQSLEEFERFCYKLLDNLLALKADKLFGKSI